MRPVMLYLGVTSSDLLILQFGCFEITAFTGRILPILESQPEINGLLLFTGLFFGLF
jgi:hypothetical protein